MLLDLSDRPITGKEAEQALDRARITVNKNTVPNEKRSPFITSGVRIGTPALTTRGMKESEMHVISRWITMILENPSDENRLSKIKGEVKELCLRFPIYRSAKI